MTMVVHTGRLPAPSIAWFKDEEPIVSDSHLEITQEPDLCQLLVKQVTPADSGTYKCVASSVMGTITKKFLLNIEEGELVTFARLLVELCLHTCCEILTCVELFVFALFAQKKCFNSCGCKVSFAFLCCCSL